MRFVGNLLWFIFGGLWLGLLWSIAGAVCFVTIVLIPFGFACFRIASFAFFPFGKDIVPTEMMGGKRITGTWLLNMLWMIVGIPLALFHAFSGILFCVTIIGIPCGIACFNISKASFAPLGKQVVSKEMAKVARERWSKEQLDKAFAEKNDCLTDAGSARKQQS